MKLAHSLDGWVIQARMSMHVLNTRLPVCTRLCNEPVPVRNSQNNGIGQLDSVGPRALVVVVVLTPAGAVGRLIVLRVVVVLAWPLSRSGIFLRLHSF